MTSAGVLVRAGRLLQCVLLYQAHCDCYLNVYLCEKEPNQSYCFIEIANINNSYTDQ